MKAMLRDSAAGFAIVCDSGGTILECRRDDLGSGAAGAAGQPFASLLDASSLDRASAMFVEVRERGASFNNELPVRTANGDVKTVYVMAGRVSRDRVLLIAAVSPAGLLELYDQLMEMNNELTNMLRSASRDTARTPPFDFDDFARMNNELATAQRELVKSNAALARANQDKSRLIGMATHDLRNPMGAIRSMSEMLMDRELSLDHDKRTELLERIRRSSDFMLALIDEMLQLTTLDAGEVRLDPETVDLGALIRGSVAVQSVLADEKQIRISTQIAPDVPPIVVDARKIEQVLYNLIGNAIKFSHAGGTIDVRLRAETVSAGSTPCVWISVQDQGPGIPEHEMTRLFQPFARTSVRPSGGEPSTGLGLAIAERIVRAHDGRIWCDSEVGVGTTFHVSLPTRT
jgi:signal transduction histidine kinase